MPYNFYIEYQVYHDTESELVVVCDSSVGRQPLQLGVVAVYWFRTDQVRSTILDSLQPVANRNTTADKQGATIIQADVIDA